MKMKGRPQAQYSTPPPSPPPPPPPRPMQTAEENIPIVFGEALPASNGAGPVVATTCEVVVAVDESDVTVASSYAVPAPSSHNNHYNSFPNDTAFGNSYGGSVQSAPGGYGYPFPGSGNASYYPASVAPCAYSSYAASVPPVSQIHVPAATVSTSPMSVRSTFTAPYSNSYSVPAPPRRNVELLRSSASTTTPMTTSSGVQLQQLPMVNMQGRRMTPYVRKPTNTGGVTRAASVGSGPSGHGGTRMSHNARPGSRMASYV
mmetsp:Transcript_20653/g.31568  ORF Transcript_20653/g.31568 Transcript_20653/m.31568 type:complete len:260 (+) Transcript_20653:52-831(+)